MMKINDRSTIEPALVFCLVLIIIFSVVTYIMMVEPWMVSNEVKEKIRIDYPYDDYKSMFCSHDSHSWWDVLICVIDIQSGNSSYSSLKYNRDTGELKGTVNGISLKNPELSYE